MQDKIRIELTEKEIKLVKQCVDNYIKELGSMTKDERMAHFKEMCPEKYLNFEKEINGKVYQVNTFFNNTSNEAILGQILRIIKNDE